MIVFNGKSADEIPGLYIEPFSLTATAEQEYDYIHIPGREEPLAYVSKSRKFVKINVNADLMDGGNIDKVHQWLTGKGVLVDSRYPDKYRTAEVLDSIKEEAVNDNILSLQIPFLCSAFRYAVEPTTAEIATVYTAVENIGTVFSEPVFEITLQKNDAPILMGDVNFDGKVTPTDASMVLEEYSRVASGGEATFTPEQFAAADMNGDGLITPSDAQAILDIATESAIENPNAIAQNIVLDVNGEKLTVGIPNAVISNGFTVTVDCGLKLIYYTTADGTKVNILQYSYGDLPLLHTGINYIKYTGNNVDKLTVTVNERWR